MLQTSHQTLKSEFTFSAFTAFIDTLSFDSNFVILSESENVRIAVLGPVPAFVIRAGQNQPSAERRTLLFRAIATVVGK